MGGEAGLLIGFRGSKINAGRYTKASGISSFFSYFTFDLRPFT
jgi:hypothetical protein